MPDIGTLRSDVLAGSGTCKLRLKPSDRDGGDDGDVEQELENRAPGPAPPPMASATPMSEAAGMIVTDMNTTIKVLDQASVSETTPHHPNHRFARPGSPGSSARQVPCSGLRCDCASRDNKPICHARHQPDRAGMHAYPGHSSDQRPDVTWVSACWAGFWPQPAKQAIQLIAIPSVDQPPVPVHQRFRRD